MKTRIINVCLYISSFVPLYLLVITKTLLEIINGNLRFNLTNTILISLMVILSFVGVGGVVYVLKRKQGVSKVITIINYTNTTDKHFLGYFSLFVLFALTFDLSKVSMSVVYLIILILIGVVYVRNHLFSINPLLNIIGYSCYDVTYVDAKGNEYSTKLYYKGKLEKAKYYVTMESSGICFAISQVIKKD